MKNSINLKEIAEICGVSVATVSRVINQNGRFSDETGKRVRKVIEEYGYRPNQIAKGLRTNKVNLVGVIVPDITNEFFSVLVLALQKELFRAGYSLMIFNTDESEAMEQQCLASMMSMNISAIVSMDDKWDLQNQVSRKTPVIYVDRKSELGAVDENAVFLLSDHEEGAYLAGKELALCGCKKTACITGLADAPVTIMRNKGFHRACQEFGMELSPDLVFVPHEVSMQSGYAIMEQALQSGKQFDGIFCETDWLAIGALSALLDHHIDVPGKVQIIGFDDIRAAKVARQPLTTIRQYSEKIGVCAANMILSYLEGNKVDRHEIIVPVELVRRTTTRFISTF